MSKIKTAFITGITGQDGSYLAELLLNKGYKVHGMVRRASTFNTKKIDHLRSKFGKNIVLHYGDLADAGSIGAILAKIKPYEIYNLGAQSHVRISFDIPEYTSNITGLGTLRMLEAMKNYCPKARFYQASSSEMFGDVLENPQTETTPFNAQSPYGIAKVFAHETAKRYRDAYGLFICCGILFNHESPNRGENFVTRKISMGVVKIKFGLQEDIYLGNLDAKRDWGYAPEYCEAMWSMLQKNKPDDYIIATGEVHSVREFVEKSFAIVGISIEWRGKGIKEKGFDKKTGRVLVKIDPKYFRANEVNYLYGDATKAKKELGWKAKIQFPKLVKLMVSADLKSIEGKF